MAGGFAGTAGSAGPTGVRIVVAGDRGTGKSSLIVTAAAETFPTNVPPVLPPTRLPEDFYPDRVPITIIDTSSRSQSIPLSLSSYVYFYLDPSVFWGKENQSLHIDTFLYEEKDVIVKEEDTKRSLFKGGRFQKVARSKKIALISAYDNSFLLVENTFVDCVGDELKQIPSLIFIYKGKMEMVRQTIYQNTGVLAVVLIYDGPEPSCPMLQSDWSRLLLSLFLWK